MEAKKQDKDFKHLVRIGDADLSGSKQVLYALRKVKGIGFMMGSALCASVGVDKTKLVGYLTDDEVDRLNRAIAHPETLNLPHWMLNRRLDPITGESRHLFGSDIDFHRDNDIKLMRKIKSYKGVRHGKGLPVRGQRTRSNFRKNKGITLGVEKKKQQPKAAEK